MKYIQSVSGLAKTLAAAATLPAPTTAGAGGVDISTGSKRWAPRSGAGYTLAYLALFADGAATLTNGEFWAFDPVTALWGFVSPLNNGGVITLSATRAFFQQLDVVAVFSRLAIVGTVGGGANVGYTLVPLAESR